MKKRLLSLLLTLVMVLGMFPLTAMAADEGENSVSSVSIEDFQFSALTNKAQDYLDEIALTLDKDEDGEYVLYVPGEGVSAYVNSKEVTLQIAAPEGYQETFSVDYTKYAAYADPEGTLETVISDNGIVKLNDYASGSEGDTTLNFSEQITVYFTETGESCNIKLVPYCNLKSLSISIGSVYRPVGQKDATTFYATVVKGTTVNITSQATIKDNSTDGINSTVTIDGQEAETITYTPDNEPGEVKVITIEIKDELRGLRPGTYTLELKTIETDLYPVVEFDNKKLTVNVGETVNLTVNATNLHGTTTYSWQAGMPANHFDVNEPTITLDTSKAANYMMTRCTVSNIVDGLTYSTATKAKTVTVQSDTTAQPEILTQPVSAEYVSGLEAQPLSVVAKGTVGGKLSYQWYSNTVNSSTGGTAIANATAANYVPDTSVVGTTYYYCEVVDTVSRIASAPVATVCVKVEVLSSDLSMAGEGTEESPFMIEDAGDLAEIRDFVDMGYTFKNNYFKFANNIDLPQNWDPIGSNPTPNEYDTGKGKYIRPFSGTLDGGGFTVTVAEGGLPLFDYVREATIKNLNIQGTKIAGYGLVNEYDVDYGTDGDYSTGDPATPHTVTIENCTIKSGTSIKYSGFIGGYASGLNIVYINNCTVEENVVVGYGVRDGIEDVNTHSVGSLAGEFNGYVTNCTSAATVYARGNGGGLIGVKGQSMGPCQVVNSSFTGEIVSQRNAGGIIGNGYNCDNTPIVTIKNCYVNADITGSKYIGGILGAEPGCVQCWSNGTGGVMDNVFVGTLTATDSDAYVGGIVGYMLSINSGNTIQNNYYLADEVDKGIGFIKYVDTSAEHETESGAIYFDSSVALPDVRGIAKPNYNRNDDPLGKDAEKLAKTVTAEQLSDGTVAALLNSSDTSLHNWITDTEKGLPIQSTEPIAYLLEVAGEFKTEYLVGEDLDFTGAVFTATWTDGNTTTPDLSDLEIKNYNKSVRGKQTVKLSFGAASVEIPVTVLLPAGQIEVSFALLGDSEHDSDADGYVHTLTAGNLSTWVAEKKYTISNNATVLDLMETILAANNITFTNSSGNYIDTVTYNGETLGEFDNGANSGWMFTVNGVHGNLGVSEQYLNDGDVVVFHYTDDYTKEVDNPENIDVNVTISNVGDVAMAQQSVSVSDLNGDGKFDVDEVLYAAHEAGYAGGAAEGYNSYIGDYGLSLGKLWGDTSGCYGYWLNNASCWSLADEVEDGDYLVAFVYSDKIGWGDNYAWFDQFNYAADSELTVTLKKSGYDAAYNTVISIVTGASITAYDADGNAIDSSKYAVKDNCDGTYTITFIEDGEYTLIATETTTPIVPAVCKASVVAGRTNTDVENIYKTTGDYLDALEEQYGISVGSIGGEWMVIGMIRSGREVDDAYYDAVVKYVRENIDENERLHKSKSTDNSRMILALTAMGCDVTDVDGHNLLEGLDEMSYLKKQGINGPIWALIALDSHDYEPMGDVTREKLIQTILDAQLADGGWVVGSTLTSSDVDMTAMAIQALAPYYNTNADVKAAVDKALVFLSDAQLADGSYGSVDGSSSESCAQVIVALTALGIDPENDARFTKNGISVVDALCAFYVENGGFKHIPNGALDGMATEQGYYALASYYRFLNGKTSLYDMSDVTIKTSNPDAPENPTNPSNPSDPTNPSNPTDPSKPGDSSTPQTGDDTNIALYGTMMVLSVAALAVLLIAAKKRKYTGKYSK